MRTTGATVAEVCRPVNPGLAVAAGHPGSGGLLYSAAVPRTRQARSGRGSALALNRQRMERLDGFYSLALSEFQGG